MNLGYGRHEPFLCNRKRERLARLAGGKGQNLIDNNLFLASRVDEIALEVRRHWLAIGGAQFYSNRDRWLIDCDQIGVIAE